jgi:hypothetical protein
MAAPTLPFWLVRELTRASKRLDGTPCDEPKAAHGFTTAEKLAEFMTAHGGARWQIDQVADREGVIVTVAELYEAGIEHLCIEPEPDGFGGLLVSVGDLLRAYGK